MVDLIPFEFYLIRYVPNIVTGEFVNIGVLLCATVAGDKSVWQAGAQFTRNWDRVQALDPDADTALLQSFGVDIRSRLEGSMSTGTLSTPPIIKGILDSFSNSIQLSGSQRTLGASFDGELDRLMEMYVDIPTSEHEYEAASVRSR